VNRVGQRSLQFAGVQIDRAGVARAQCGAECAQARFDVGEAVFEV
jgi:hypothetical protein